MKLIGDRTSKQHATALERESLATTVSQMRLTEGFVSGDLEALDYKHRAERLRLKLRAIEDRRHGVSVDPKLLISQVTNRLQIATSLWDLYQQFGDEQRIELLRSVFSSVVIAREGIVGFSLKPPFDRLAQTKPSRGRSDRYRAAAEAFVGVS